MVLQSSRRPELRKRRGRHCCCPLRSTEDVKTASASDSLSHHSARIVQASSAEVVEGYSAAVVTANVVRVSAQVIVICSADVQS